MKAVPLAGASRVPRLRVRGGSGEAHEDVVAIEEPLEIQLGGASLAVVMRTPGHDEELALGFLVTERVVASPAQVVSVRHCRAVADPDAAENVLRVLLADGVAVDLDALRRNLYASSSCGICGKATIANALATAPALDDASRFDADFFAALPQRLAAAQPAFAATGGLHAAGLFAPDGELLVVREDVGRHNAVDKVIGWALRAGRLPLAGHVLLVSGRISYELVQKALVARIPVLAAISAPSSLAVELAQRARLTLIGFLRGRSFNVYGERERVSCRTAPAMTDTDDPREPGPAAGGLGSIVSTLRSVSKMGAKHALQGLARLNQPGGFACSSCAWPEPHTHGAIEFCENGAKALAHEGTRRRVTRDWLARTSLAELRALTDHALEAQGRLVEPLLRRAGASHFEPIGWDAAFARAGAALRELEAPDQAVFYTSGRASNEAAFLWQLFARQLGTNNLPDCSNLCHESSGEGLGEAIGIGKGTVSLDDIEQAGAIFVIGQNPGTNHPRMLTTLAAARRRGARIVAINPLRERGLERFAQPQDPLALLGRAVGIAELYLQVRVGGDIALLKGIMKEVLAAEARAPGRVLDWPFLRDHTLGFEALRADLEAHDFAELEQRSGVSRGAMREAAEIYCAADGVVACWAMGITQHRHGVANVQEILNLLLLRGNIGRPGAGPCPVRGHSNVQGDRTVGITERPRAEFLARLGAEFGFEPPRAPGFDTLAAIGALRAGAVRVFLALGGNFAVATPDTRATVAALGRCELAVQIATTLNRTPLVAGREALLLPCLARSELDVQAGGEQFVTVEDSMSVVHASHGSLPPASPALRSEPAIVAGLAAAALHERSRVPWLALVEDYDRIRARIERVIPGFEDYARRARAPGGFRLPSGARTRHFATPSGRALFRVHALPEAELAPGHFLLTTIRSHDQFNTTVYGFDDRLRGLAGDRRVVLLHPEELATAGLRAGQAVDLTSHFRGATRTLRGFRALPYDVPRGCAAAYFPEANALVPLESRAERSHTPSYKSIEISVTPASGLE